MGSAVIAKDLTKIYAEGNIEVKAVSSVDLELKEGEIVGLFGPSGSGKTTLLSMLGCILRPSSGTISMFGVDTTAMNETDLQHIRKKNMYPLSFRGSTFSLRLPLLKMS